MSAERPRRRRMTAAEFVAELERDPEYVRKRRDLEAFHQRRVEENRRAASSVVTELALSGFAVQTVSDLFNLRLHYRGAIPILLKWLPRVANPAVKEDIVRALSVKWAKPAAAPALIAEYRDPDADHHLRWAIGNALSVVAEDSVFDEVVDLVRDRGYGKAREMLAVALGNMKSPDAVDVLMELLDDEEIAGHALIALGRLRAKKARPLIEGFLTHPKTWVRNEAKRALARIDRSL